MKFLCTDIDETLIDRNLKIPENNLKSIKKFLEEGNKVILATGRPFRMIPQYIYALGLNDYGSFYICLNGGMTLNSSFEVVGKRPFDKTYLKELFSLGIQRDHCVQIHTDKENYAYNPSPEETKRYELIGDTFVLLREEDLLSFESDREDCILKIIYQDETFSRLEETFQQHKELLSHYNISFSSHRYMEINSIGVSKGDALRKLFSDNQWDLGRLVTVGDSLNDYSMMLEESFNVAVKNAVPKLLEKADYVTKNDHNQGAVAEVMERMDEFLKR